MALQGPHQVAKKSTTTILSEEPSITEVLKEDMLWIWLTPPFFFFCVLVLVLVDWEVGVAEADAERARSRSCAHFTYSLKLWTPILYLVCVKCIGLVVEKCFESLRLLWWLEVVRKQVAVLFAAGAMRCRVAGLKSDVATLERYILQS